MMTIRTAIMFCVIGSVGILCGDARGQEESESVKKRAAAFRERASELFENPFQRNRSSAPKKRDKAESRRRTENQVDRMFEYEEVVVNESDDELLKLRKQRYNVAVNEIDARLMEYERGLAPIDSLCEAALRVAVANRAILDEPKAILESHDKFVSIATEFEKFSQRKMEAGVGTVQEVYQAKYFRLDAEIARLKYKRSLKGESRRGVD